MNKVETQPVQHVTWKAFLETQAPGRDTLISDIADRIQGGDRLILRRDDIELYCDDSMCEGMRIFARTGGAIDVSADDLWRPFFIFYQCRNCVRKKKTFAVVVAVESIQTAGSNYEGRARKLGELPHFGPHTPPQVLRLIQDDADLFLTGRRAENQGMGIGAFAYYRRVVENEKKRLFDKIIEVARKLDAPSAQIAELEGERDNWQFSNSVDTLKGAIPAALLINGHNPLTLLHRALSDGIHAGSDAECLEAARSIRILLIDLAERAAQVTRERAELDAAVTKLINPRRG